MSSIDKFENFVKKALGDVSPPEDMGKLLAEAGSSSSPSTSSPTPVMTGASGPAGWGVKKTTVPAQFRLYLDGDFIPGTTVRPTDVKIQPEQGPRGGAFIDKRLLQTHQKELYEQSHSQAKTPAYGGIIVNKQGQILLREAAGKFGFEGMPHSWTLSKGKLDKGEKPEDAALREVLEETGIKASITSEVPGHFTSENSSTKFFMMTVDEDTGKFGKAETSAVKWVDTQEAIDIFKQNVQKDKDGKVIKDSNGHPVLHESSKRDAEAVAMAMYHHNEVNKDQPKTIEEAHGFLKSLGKQTNFTALTSDLISHYIEHEEMPPEFGDVHGKYSIFIKTLGTHTRQPLPIHEHSKGSQLGYGILPALYESLDKKYGLSYPHSFSNFHQTLNSRWAASGVSTTSPEPHVLQEIISELSNTPANFMYNKTIPEDVSKSGRPIFRSDEQRNEIIEKFSAWAGTLNQLNDGQNTKMSTLKDRLANLFDLDDSLPEAEKFMLDSWKIDSAIKSCKALSVPSYMIKDAVRDKIAERYGLTKVGDINKKIKALKIKGVPTTKTPAHAKAGDTEGDISQVSAKGEYSWKDPVTGEKEKYDFEDGSMATVKVREGGQIEEKEVPAWELMTQRAKRVTEARASKIPSKHKKLIGDLGKSMLTAKFGSSKQHTSSSIDRAGRGFISEYARHTRAMSKMAFEAAWPNDDYIYVGRKTSAPREIIGDVEDNDITSDSVSEADLVRLGMPTHHNGTGESLRKPLRTNIHSTSIAGGSFNPNAYTDLPLWISTKIHKDDILQMHSLNELHGGGERESIFINNPDRESSVIWTKDGEHSSANWVAPPDGHAGLIPEGIHDRKDEGDVFTNGVFNPHLNYKDELEPATSEDDPIVKTFSKHKAMQLGSNKGGLYKMKSGANKGKLYYIKHDNPAAAANEGLSNELYKIAGINVPNTNVVKFGGGNALMSEWLPDHNKHHSSGQAPEAFQNHPDLQSGFLVDAMLANYDVAGMNFDNIVESGGTVYRLDQGGSLNLRAQGSPKENFYDWNGPHISELTSMVSPDTSPQASQLYQNMDDKTWEKAAQNLLTLTNSRIQETVEQSTIPPKQMDGMTKTLQRRRDSIIKWIGDTRPTILLGQEEETDWKGKFTAPIDLEYSLYSKMPEHSNMFVNAVHDQYNILKMELLKATDPELEKLKNAPSLWISGKREDDSEELTEDFDLSEQIKEISKTNLDDINMLTKEDYE